MPKKDDDEPIQIDMFGGKQARDEGMQRVGDHNPDYIQGGLAWIANQPNGTVLTGEDVRLRCLAAGLRYHHQNAHGTLIRMAVERGLLRPTGRWVPPKATPSHHSMIREYRTRTVLHPLPPVSPTPTPETPTPETPASPETNAYYDAQGRFIHNTCGEEGCTESPGHVIGCSTLHGRLGMWYCKKHFVERGGRTC